MNDMDKNTFVSDEGLYDDPLFCTFVELLHAFIDTESISPRLVWSDSLDCLQRLSKSKRPDLLVPDLVNELCLEYPSGNAVTLVLICTVYMICCQDKVNNPLWEAAKRIAATVTGHPLLDAVLKYQRVAEEREEQNGRFIPADIYTNPSAFCLEDTPPVSYGKMIPSIPEDLHSCVADKSRFGEFCHIIRNKICPFIQSEEGTAQMWTVVMMVSKEQGYISNRCKTKRFAQLIAAICPEAGSASKIDQNMQKYNKIKDEKENDLSAIRSRFPAAIEKSGD